MQKNQIQNRIITALKQSVQWAQAKENKLLSQVMNMQRKLNNLQQTKAQIRKKQTKQVLKQVQQIPKQSNIAVQSQKKISEIIAKAQQQMHQLENPDKKSKVSSLNNQKSNKITQPLPQIQKKPPIPTVNRAKQPQSFVPKPNYHYRNKNEVTGKITQTPVIRSGSKAHTSSNHARKQQNSNIFHANNSVQKPKSHQIQKQKVIVVKAQQSLSTTKTSTLKQNKRQLPPQQNTKTNPINQEQKITYIDFASFRIPINNLISDFNQKSNKKSFSKRAVIQNLISQYAKNQIGYKQNEGKAMTGFLNSFNKLAATRSKLPIEQGLKICSRFWQGHIQTFNFTNLVQSFENLLQSNPISQQYAPDAKTSYKIRLWHQLINQIFQQQIKTTRQNLKLPPTLGINFEMNSNSNQQIQFLQNQNDRNNLGNPYKNSFYSALQQQWEQLKNLQNFDKQALKKLRLLISICLYHGKRSPVIIQVPKYEQWKESYQ